MSRVERLQTGGVRPAVRKAASCGADGSPVLRGKPTVDSYTLTQHEAETAASKEVEERPLVSTRTRDGGAQ